MRGKKKGATSFVKVILRELNRVLKEDAVVIISEDTIANSYNGPVHS